MKFRPTYLKPKIKLLEVQALEAELVSELLRESVSILVQEETKRFTEMLQKNISVASLSQIRESYS